MQLEVLVLHARLAGLPDSFINPYVEAVQAAITATDKQHLLAVFAQNIRRAARH